MISNSLCVGVQVQPANALLVQPLFHVCFLERIETIHLLPIPEVYVLQL